MTANKPKGLFITGTDTGVGKSLVAAALARILNDCGLKVAVLKPAETGVDDPSQLGPDGQLLKWAARSTQSADSVCPYRLNTPAAPSVASSQEQVQIDYNALVQHGRELIDTFDFCIVEGAGGLMVPLAGGFLMGDFARSLELPLLVVCRSNLGTINHTLLTLFSARHLELPVAGYILNNMPPEQTVAEKTAANTLATMTMDELLGVLDQVDGDDQQKVTELVRQITQLNTRSLLARYLPTIFAKKHPPSFADDGLSAELREQLVQTAARSLKGMPEKLFTIDSKH